MDISTSTSLFLSIIVASIARIKYIKSRTDLPIPLTLSELDHPLFGLALNFNNKIEATGKICVENANQDGLSCFYLVNRFCMGITHPEHVKEVLQHETYRQADLHLKKFLGDRSLLLMNGNEWKSHRRIISKAFKWEHLQDMVADINGVAETLTGVLRSQSKTNGGILDIWQLMKSTTLEIIGITAFGFKFGDLESSGISPIAEAVDLLNSEYNRRVFQSPLNIFARFYWLPTPSNFAFKNAVAVFVGKISSIISQRRDDIAAGKQIHTDMMAYLFDAHDGDDGSAGVGNVKLTDEDLLGHLATIMGAGFETTSIALTYLFYAIATHPHVEAAVLEEINRVLDDGRMPTNDDLKNRLVYCNAVVMEVLRLYPPVPLVARMTKNPVVLPSANVTIPANTLCVIPIWWINRSPLNFDDPLQFKPERFLEDKDIHRYSFLPFSSGARDCVGRRFAMMELVAVFVVVIRKIKFLPKDGYELIPVPTGVAQKPLHGMPLWIADR